MKQEEQSSRGRSSKIVMSSRGYELFQKVLQARREAAEKTGEEVDIPLLPREVLIGKIVGKEKTYTFMISEEELQRIERVVSGGKEITSDQIKGEVITEKWVDGEKVVTRQPF